ncbi:MAG: hemolysin family protein [Phycisphaerales bacterium]
MSSGLAIALILATAATTYLAALAHALLEVSESAIEDRFEARGGGGRWMFGRLPALCQLVGFLRTLGRVTVTLLLVVAFSGMEAPGETWHLVVAGGTAIAILWLFTSVVSGSLARHATVGIVVGAAPLLRAIDTVGWPLRKVYELADEAVRRLTGANLRSAEVEEELLRTIEDSQRQGGLDESSAQIIENVIAFSDTEVGSVMTPRTDIEGIAYTDDLAAIRTFIGEAGHSRIPVHEESLDRILGILYVKDLVRYLGTDGRGFALRPLLREPLRVPETKRVRDLLADFQRHEVHMAIVIDEYGGTSGLVTIEDLLEEIVGEIHDEHEPEDEAMPELSASGEDLFEADGRFDFEDLAERLGFEPEADRDYDTVAGFLLGAFGRVPQAGEHADAHGWRFMVTVAEPTRIRRVRIERLAAIDSDRFERSERKVSAPRPDDAD